MACLVFVIYPKGVQIDRFRNWGFVNSLQATTTATGHPSLGPGVGELPDVSWYCGGAVSLEAFDEVDGRPALFPHKPSLGPTQ